MTDQDGDYYDEGAQNPTRSDTRLERDLDNSELRGHSSQLIGDDERNQSPTASNPTYGPLPLLDGHAKSHCQEARTHFSSERPPFVSANRGDSGTQRAVILATSNGKRPAKPHRVTIVSRRWSKTELYWTLDLNERSIVKGFAGGALGITYRSWLGIEKGFSQLPVAFSAGARHPKHPPREKKRKDFNVEETQPEDIGTKNSTRLKKPRLSSGDARKETSSTVAKTEKKKQTDHLKPRKRPSYHAQPLNDLPKHQGDYVTIDTLPATAREGEVSAVSGSTGKIHNAARNPSEHTGAVQSRDERMRQQTTNRETTSSRSLIEQLHDADYTDEELSKLPPGVPSNHTRSKKSKPVIVENDESDELDNAAPPTKTVVRGFRSTRPTSGPFPTPSVSKSSHTSTVVCQVSPPPPTFSLPSHKIHQTTLHVRLVAPSTGFVPLRLRSCVTVDKFFTSVLGVWDIEETNLVRINIRFDWMPAEMPMVMKKSPADVFELFLETIDEAPCWARGGPEKCKVDVEVVAK